jgi:hypothetical protein
VNEESSIRVFPGEGEYGDEIALVLTGASIVDFQGELTPACSLTRDQARDLAIALANAANRNGDQS